VVTYSDGRKSEESLRIPTQIYRNVYRSGAAYLEGDSVTHDGSMWVALADTKAKPGTGCDWQLSVKHGKDGVSITGPAAKPWRPMGHYDGRASYEHLDVVSTQRGLWLATRDTDEPPPQRDAEGGGWLLILPMPGT
jgi:hypothetical protein